MIFFRVNNCCFFNLKTGSYLICGLEIFACVSVILVNIFMDLPSITLFFFAIGYSVFNILAIVGNKKENHIFILPWIIANFIIIMIILAILIWIFVQFFNISTKQPEVQLDCFFLILLLIFGIFDLVIRKDISLLNCLFQD